MGLRLREQFLRSGRRRGAGGGSRHTRAHRHLERIARNVHRLRERVADPGGQHSGRFDIVLDQHGEAFAGDAAEIALARDRAVHHGVADDDRLFRHDARVLRRLDDDASAGEALADIVVGVADDFERQPFDAERAERMLAVFLHGIDQQRASVVLLDLTGVHKAEADFANAIVRAARAAHLLGANVVLTGIEPNMARMFVEVNADFSKIEMKGTLGDGVRWALAKRNAG